MNTELWEWFTLGELFYISASKDSSLLNSKTGVTPYISSSSQNNGVSGTVDVVAKSGTNTITIARNGSVGSAFYHPYNYCASPDDVRILRPKFTLTPNIALFICTLIEREKYRFAYSRKFGTQRMITTSIKLPTRGQHRVDWNIIEKRMARIITQLPLSNKQILSGVYNHSSVNSNNNIKLNISTWKWFSYDEIFDIKKGFYNKKPEENTLGTIPFIGATDSNNGITSMHNIESIDETSKTGKGPNVPLKSKIFGSNCITVSNNGSIGYAFYQPRPFTCTHNVNPLYLKDKQLNPYIAMFLCTLIEKERYRWAYGRKWRPSRMPKSKIKLPVNSVGNPDWQFMENYIKSLPYSKTLEINLK